MQHHTRKSRATSYQELETALERADELIWQGNPHQAVELLQPFLETHPRHAELHYYLGYAHAKAGDAWAALPEYERAQDLGDGHYWLPLASLYLEIDLRVHALRAFRQALQHSEDFPIIGNIPGAIEALEQEVADLAHSLSLPVERAETGLYHMERGRRALSERDFPAAITFSQKAIDQLGDWPPPHNNLSLGFFWNGQPAEAIAAARQVLSHAPENPHALSNLVRYLAWTGQEEEARQVWAGTKTIPTSNDDARRKLVEAAAILGEDEVVYRALRSLASSRGNREAPPLSLRERFFFAIAAANTGRRAEAQRLLRKLRHSWSGADAMLQALDEGQSGPGWADRFPYFHSTGLLPRDAITHLAELLDRRDARPPRQVEREMRQFAERFPQAALVAEKLIVEEGYPQMGIDILVALKTPEAYQVLRRFGQSQLGDDDIRIQAMAHLMEAEEINEGDLVRMWLDGAWREVQLRTQEPPEEYPIEVAELLNQGIEAQHRGDDEQAERLFRQALELEPRAKQAYNNLGAIHARREEHEQARELFHQALEIDPLYPVPLCNLANYLLSDGDVTGAEKLLEPLLDAPPHQPPDIAFYSYTRARILYHKREYDAARQALREALRAVPDYELAQDLLDHLNQSTFFLKAFDKLVQGQRERYQAKRKRMQKQITTKDISLPEALSIYTKDALTGMARIVLLDGGWSSLRKAELLEEIVEALRNPDRLAKILESLTDDERAALRHVLDQGGAMDWQDFAAHYDDDGKESPYWNVHKPQTTMGRLRRRGLLVEVKTEHDLLIVIPVELRPLLKTVLD